MAKKVDDSKGGLKALIFFLLALVAGGSVIVVITQLIASYQKSIDEGTKPEETAMAIIAARDLFQGVKITEEDLAVVEIPTKYLPHNVFVSAEHVIGRVPRERILVNEYIRDERLADPEEGVGLNAIIPRGMRAISVNVGGGRAVSGFVNPGNRVDVIVTIAPGDGTRERETHTVLQAVPVLAVNDRMKGAKTGKEAKRKLKPSVTLAVTPEEAEQVGHASELGEITLALRNDLDLAFKTLDGTDTSELYGEEPKQEVKKAGPKKATPGPAEPSGGTLQIYKGTQGKEHQLDVSGNIK